MNRIPTSSKHFFAIPPTPNAWFQRLRRPNSDPEIIKTRPLGRRMTKNTSLSGSKIKRKLSKCGTQIYPNSTEIQAGTRRSPFLCCQVPLDRHRCQRGRNSLPSDMLGNQNWQHPRPKPPRRRNYIRSPAYQQHSQQRNVKNKSETQQTKVRGRRHGRSLKIISDYETASSTMLVRCRNEKKQNSPEGGVQKQKRYSQGRNATR